MSWKLIFTMPFSLVCSSQPANIEERQRCNISLSQNYMKFQCLQTLNMSKKKLTINICN